MEFVLVNRDGLKDKKDVNKGWTEQDEGGQCKEGKGKGGNKEGEEGRWEEGQEGQERCRKEDKEEDEEGYESPKRN